MHRSRLHIAFLLLPAIGCWLLGCRSRIQADGDFQLYFTPKSVIVLRDDRESTTWHYLTVYNSDLTKKESGVKDKMPMLEDGQTIAASVIIWCTGHRPDFSWINECVTDERGWPVTERGVCAMEGLYFIGMPFQFGLTSSLVSGVGRDAEYICNKVVIHRQAN
jgi:hypothetical protein